MRLDGSTLLKDDIRYLISASQGRKFARAHYIRNTVAFCVYLELLTWLNTSSFS